jgi:hypothetical protein
LPYKKVSGANILRVIDFAKGVKNYFSAHFIRRRGILLFLGYLMIWSLIQFFDKQKKWKTFWQTLLSYVIFIGIYIVLAGITMLIIKLVY